MTTSKSPRRVLQVAYDAAREAVPAYSHINSPHKFTQPQLLACLVLKEFLRLDYRGLAAHLADHAELTRLLGMEAVPHYTTFQKAADRLLVAASARKLFDAVLARALRDKVRRRRVPLAAVDGTGLESRHVSRYYVKRRSNTGTGTQVTTYARYPKVVLVTDCRTHLVLAAVPGRGPASDLVLFKAALRQPAGRWRRRMKRRFDRAKYGQRWQTEAVNSMIKRRLGSALRARTYWSQCREIILRVITHNVMVVIRVRVFYRAILTPYPSLILTPFPPQGGFTEQDLGARRPPNPFEREPSEGACSEGGLRPVGCDSGPATTL